MVPIYLRVTVGGARFEQSTQRYIALSKWSADAGKAKNSTEEVRTINYFLDALKQKVYNYQWEIIHQGLPLTIEEFRKKWLGIKERMYSVLEVFQQHNEQLRQLIGTDCSKATYGKYRTTFDHTVNFIKWKYQSNDLAVCKLTYSFIMTGLQLLIRPGYPINFKTVIDACAANNVVLKLMPTLTAWIWIGAIYLML